MAEHVGSDVDQNFVNSESFLANTGKLTENFL